MSRKMRAERAEYISFQWDARFPLFAAENQRDAVPLIYHDLGPGE